MRRNTLFVPKYSLSVELGKGLRKDAETFRGSNGTYVMMATCRAGAQVGL